MSDRGVGEYRRRDTARLVGDLLVSRRPLVVTRLNDTAADLFEALGDEDFRAPAAVAASKECDVAAVERLFERLHDRGFLEWRPTRDPEFRPPVSVVVTVRNDRAHLERCLDALGELRYPSYEVVVVDDGSTDGTKAMVEGHELAAAARARVISVGGPNDPIGIGASRNRGVEAAAHGVIAFTDADCRPRPEWLSELVPCLAANDVVGGRIRPAGESAASAYEGINSSLDMGAYASRIDPAGATPYLPTANLVGHRRVFDAVPFPARDVAEDVDVCWRAVTAGFDVVYTPTGVVEHVYRTDLSSVAARRATYASSEALLAREHGRDEGQQVEIPTTAVFLFALLLVGVLGRGPMAAGGIVAAGGLTVALAGIRGRRMWRRYARLPATLSLRDVASSWGRERASSSYTVAREVTRYYAVPIALVGGLAWGAGATAVGVGTLAAVVVAVGLPVAVEYRVHAPDATLGGYGLYYLADHFGYQYGLYRGAFTYRTIAHVRPDARFRLVGPGARLSAATGADDDTEPTRTVTVGGATARFRVASSTEEWWFGDEGLRGEHAVLADLLARLEPGDVFLDVGANVGLYSCLVGRALADGTVVSVEPHPRNAARLEENLAANGVAARVIRRALGRRNRRGALTGSEEPPGTGTPTLLDAARSSAKGAESENEAEFDGGSERTPRQVGRKQSRGVADASLVDTPVVTGDSLVASGESPQPTVVKIDVEGAEADVVAGLAATLTAPACRLVYCEVHPGLLDGRDQDPDAVRRTLRDCGFLIETVRELPNGRAVLRAQKPTPKRGRTVGQRGTADQRRTD